MDFPVSEYGIDMSEAGAAARSRVMRSEYGPRGNEILAAGSPHQRSITRPQECD